MVAVVAPTSEEILITTELWTYGASYPYVWVPIFNYSKGLIGPDGHLLPPPTAK